MAESSESFEGKRRERRSTATSAFGASRREGHDSSSFYARFRTPEISSDARLADRDAVDAIRDRIFHADSRSMIDIPDASVGLVVTSPPYFAGKAYEEALGEGHIPADYVDYLQMVSDVLRECQRVLEPGGRIVVNVANLGRKPFRSLAGDVTSILQDDLGMLLRGEIIWLKQRGSSGNCAWGSFRSASNPVLRDTTERLIVASKGRFDRAVSASQRVALGLPHVSSVTVDEFMEATLDVWEIPPESATRVNHPAPFPVALVERCIDLYSFVGDVVLDPFMGSGSTAIAARRTGRSYVGYETDPGYVAIAEERLRSEPDSDAHDETRSLRDIVDEVIARAGCEVLEWGARIVSGMEMTGRARTADGAEFYFDIVGGFQPGRAGLSRGDLMWRSIGRATVVNHVMNGARTVLFSAGPPEKSSGGPALTAVTGPGLPVAGVVIVSDVASASERLQSILG